MTSRYSTSLPNAGQPRVRHPRTKRGACRLAAEEITQFLIGFLRRLLREVMSARQRFGATDIGGVAFPDFRRAGLVIAANAAGRAPQNQRRAVDPLAGVKVLGIRVEIDAE